jgi:hypothetical protein
MRITGVPANPTLLDNSVLNDVCLGPTLATSEKINLFMSFLWFGGRGTGQQGHNLID